MIKVAELANLQITSKMPGYQVESSYFVHEMLNHFELSLPESLTSVFW